MFLFFTMLKLSLTYLPSPALNTLPRQLQVLISWPKSRVLLAIVKWFIDLRFTISCQLECVNIYICTKCMCVCVSVCVYIKCGCVCLSVCCAESFVWSRSVKTSPHRMPVWCNVHGSAPRANPSRLSFRRILQAQRIRLCHQSYCWPCLW